MYVKFGHIASFGPCFFCVLGVEFHGGFIVLNSHGMLEITWSITLTAPAWVPRFDDVVHVID